MPALPYPIATYGTLRPGAGNDSLWQGAATVVGDVRIRGYRLVTRGWFPYAIPSPADAIAATLIQPHPDQYDEVLAACDVLEGVPSHYQRVIAFPPGGAAWLYVPRDPTQYADLPPVLDNDWYAHRHWLAGHPVAPHTAGPA